MKTSSVYLGIDVSKRKLHLGTPDKFLGEFSNDVAGHRRLIKKVLALQPVGVLLLSEQPVKVVLESSGGDDRAICDALQDAGVRVTVSSPGRIKHFAQSLNILAKTDKLDARLIARFGQATQPKHFPYWIHFPQEGLLANKDLVALRLLHRNHEHGPAATPKTLEKQRRFRALVDRRQQVIEDRVRETNRLETCADANMRAHIEAHVESLQEQECALDQQIAEAVKADKELHHKQKVMTQLGGVGPQTVRTLLAHLPELGSLDRQQVAAIATGSQIRGAASA